MSLYIYLGITIDDKLNWHQHSFSLLKKLKQRLYFIRKLNSFHIDPTILGLFYRAVFEGVLSFCVACWGGNCRVKDKILFESIIMRAGKLTRNSFNSFEIILNINLERKVLSILKSEDHPIFKEIIFSERSGRVLYIRTKTERYKNSFLPLAVKLIPFKR